MMGDPDTLLVTSIHVGLLHKLVINYVWQLVNYLLSVLITAINTVKTNG